MQVFINIFFAVAAWMAGIYAFTVISSKLKNYKVSHDSGELVSVGLLAAAIIATVVLAALLNTTQGALFMLAGYVVSFLSVVDPFAMTQEKADEIGRAAEQKQALKDQQEEKKREEERIRKENAKIYAEEKKRQAGKG